MSIDTKKLYLLLNDAAELPWILATSNSWRRIVDARHTPVVSPCNQPDGHPDLLFAGGVEGPNAQLMIEAVNALPELLATIDAQATEIERLREALQGLDEAYCRAGTGLSKEERHEDRLRLIAARAALQGESHA
jgi:hypothetical protein